MKLLFSSVNTVIDPSSGAAITIRTLLRLLSRFGVETRSFGASVFDQIESAVATDNLRKAGALPLDVSAPASSLWELRDGEVVHRIWPARTPDRRLQSANDEDHLFELALKELDTNRPDVILTYGAGRYEKKLVVEAQRRGIATVFYLAHPGYKSLDSFRNIDQVFTDTAATRDLYVERLGLSPYAIGKFVDRPNVTASAPRRGFVTYVNPSAEKGVTLFYRIAELAAQVAPEIAFLVVESRSTLSQAELRTGMRFSRMSNIHRVGLQKDMAEVFSRTRILLQPSVWHESGARTAIEAMSLGLPIVATTRGGIPEVAGEAGILIPAPAPMVDRHWLIPPLVAAIPWVEALRQLTEDETFYAEHRELSLRAYAAHDPQKRIPDIVALLERLVASKAA